MHSLIRKYFKRKELDELLFQSIQEDEFEITGLLLKEGANANASTQFSGNILDNLGLYYRPHQKIAVLKTLLEAGANPNARLTSNIENQGCLLHSITSIQEEHMKRAGEELSPDYIEQMKEVKNILRSHGAIETLEAEYWTEMPVFRRGKQNPEKVNSHFFKFMIASGTTPTQLRQLIKTNAKALAPKTKRKKVKKMGQRERALLFEQSHKAWNYNRFGISSTLLEDGSVIHIGGEHEDYYDEDFCIFNDVLKVNPSGEMELFFYPDHIFPPTDFHSATFYKDQIIIIGGLGYKQDRREGVTHVFSLNLSNFSISKWTTKGQNPGWIYKHTALLDLENDRILVFGGSTIKEDEVKDAYCLHLKDKRWERLK